VLGRRVVPRLIDAGHDVTAVGRTPDKRALLESEGARGVTLDLFDPEAVRNAVRGADAILNLATAVPPTGLRMFLAGSWHEMDRVRREVSTNLVEAALAGDTVERLIQESFAPIYADGGQAWLDETAPAQPARYDRSALDAEANAERLTRAGRVGVVLRFGMLYGPYDAATDQLIDAIRRGWFPLFGRPEAYCSWVEHGDAAEAVVEALPVPAGIYNVVESQPLTRQDLGDGIARLLAVRPPRFLPPWAAHLGGVLGETLARSLRVSNRKLQQASGWAPRYRTALAGFAAIIAAEEEQREVRRSFRAGGSARRHARR